MKVTYDDSFYKAMHDANLASARAVMPLVLELLPPVQSVVDVGCGRGLWLKACSENGISDIFGVDGAWVKPEDLAIPKDCFESRDMEQHFSTGRTADLAISLEVAEHLSPARADDFVSTLVATAPVILFSAAIPGQGGTDHRNEQWPAYWVERFERHGYAPIDALRSKVWNNPQVSFFYAQNVCLFVKIADIEKYPTLAKLKETGHDTMLPLVHPQLFSYVHEDAERWKLVVPYINKLPLGILRGVKSFMSRGRST